MRYVLLLLFGITSIVSGQEFVSSKIKGLRIYGSTESSLPIARLQSRPITLEFDIDSEDLPALQLRFFHCDRDWNVTPTSFVNDDIRNRSRSDLAAEPSPNGVRGYTFHYTVKIPGYPIFDGFLYSGNYVYELWDRENDEKLVRGRFFVTEDRLTPRMRVANRQEPSAVNPYYQVYEIRVGFGVPRSDSTTVFEAAYFTRVDVYKNREMTRPRVISTDDQDPHTFIDGLGMQKLEFLVDDMETGSEYRVLDLRDNGFYPQGRPLRPKDGADVSRFLARMKPDNNGGSSIVRGTSYADYLDFQFELVLSSSGQEKVYVVGDFNCWRPGPLSVMSYSGDRYVWKTALRRGVYDYQYVLGDDWVALEGNDWSTTNIYTALVYYYDPRFGGFDRLIGVASGRSPGAPAK